MMTLLNQLTLRLKITSPAKQASTACITLVVQIIRAARAMTLVRVTIQDLVMTQDQVTTQVHRAHLAPATTRRVLATKGQATTHRAQVMKAQVTIHLVLNPVDHVIAQAAHFKRELEA